MEIRIVDMEPGRITEYARLYASVFNAPPWNDAWTEETAAMRIQSMMETGLFVGKALYGNGELAGMIWGQKDLYFDGLYFQIQEFCVKTAWQGRGLGAALLSALRQDLARLGVVRTYLLTAKGESTEGYYRRRGFVPSDHMIFMSDGGPGA